MSALRCKVGDLAIFVGRVGSSDPNNAIGAIVEIVGPSQRSDCDWSVLWRGHPCHGSLDGTWGARDIELVPLRPGPDETIVSTPRELPILVTT